MDAKLKYKAKKIKIVFFDIDDTLRVKNTGFMPESIQQVFKSLKAKGILTGIASGRGIYGVVPEIRALEPDFFVTLNGAYVEDKKGQVIHQRVIPQPIVEAYVAWTKKLGLIMALRAVMTRCYPLAHLKLARPWTLFIQTCRLCQIIIKITMFIRCGPLKRTACSLIYQRIWQLTFARCVGIQSLATLSHRQAPKQLGWLRSWSTWGSSQKIFWSLATRSMI